MDYTSVVKTQKIIAVINMSSGRTRQLEGVIKDGFEELKIPLTKLSRVKDPKQLNRAYANAIKQNPDIIVIGGGDGTLISGIEYLTNKNYKGKVGMLPLGTANYLVRNLSIPLDIESAIETIAKGKARTIPLGVANGKYFALNLTLGLTQKLSANVSDSLKRRHGQIAYTLELFKQSKGHKPFRYEISSESLSKPLKGTTHQILLYNSDVNQQVKLAPDHSLYNPSLKLVVFDSGKSLVKLYWAFFIHVISFGRIRKDLKVRTITDAVITTRPALPASYDGEVSGASPYKISMIKKSVKVIS